MSNESDNKQIDEALRLLVDAAQKRNVDFIQFVALMYEKFIDGNGDSLQKVKDLASKVNKNAHEKPWIYVATAVLGGFVAGLFCRRRE